MHILHPWRKIKCYRSSEWLCVLSLCWDAGKDGVGWWHCTSGCSALTRSPQENRGALGTFWGFSIPLGFAVHELPAAQTRTALVWWLADISATKAALATSAVSGTHRFGIVVVWGRLSPPSCPTASTNQKLSAHQLTTTKSLFPCWWRQPTHSHLQPHMGSDFGEGCSWIKRFTCLHPGGKVPLLAWFPELIGLGFLSRTIFCSVCWSLASSVKRLRLMQPPELSIT